MCNCDFCKNKLTVPKDYFKTIYKKIKEKNDKNYLQTFIILNVPYKKILKKKIYIPYYCQDLINVTRKNINYKYYDIGLIKCNYCNKNSCPSHFLWGNFYNGKCDKCDKLISICGWCKKTICQSCDD
jgi:hypothetical protein